MFKEKKGSRQGDPMSSYLFVLVMEYMHRTVQQLWHEPQFNYHPRFDKLGVFHICFVDDLVMCCRVDMQSIQNANLELSTLLCSIKIECKPG